MRLEMSQRSTEETLQHHLQALGRGDVDATMADYAPKATIFTPDGVLHGHSEIRPFFEASVSEVLPPGSDVEMHQKFVEGEVAYIVWSAESANFKIPLGTDTFVIQGGQIVTQTFAGLIIKKIE